ncbi:hypothetical protein B5807_06999 [Epicoccum nigrum]|uniref:Uncharacterized protein n=1 Tax=Epicoccum nigrum TaxID=105696 RepID=A0A1Y2LZX8_EPING|nr:hypothetical protein B5807_06999 [Epicoccum nigrum]
MSQQRSVRASKFRAAKITATMTSAAPSSPSKGGEETKRTLRFPRHIWNAYQPQPSCSSLSDASQAAPEPVRKRDRACRPTDDEHQPATSRPRRATPPRPCNVKTTSFQYGGPSARIAGQDAGMITLRQPCLRPTCTSCLAFHAHLMTGELGGLERAMDDVDPQVDDGVLKDGGGKSKRCDSVMGSPETMEVLPQLRRPVGLLFRSTNGRRDFKALAL